MMAGSRIVRKENVITCLSLGIVILLVVIIISSYQDVLKNAPEVFLDDKSSLGNEKLPEDVCIETKDSMGHDDLLLVRKNGHSCGLANANLDSMENYQLSLTLHSILDNIDTVCARKIRVGNLGKGGWEVCDDIDVRPRRDCVVYSFTHGTDFSFDDGMATVYGCQVYSFNPNVSTTTRNNTAKKIHFQSIGVGKQNLKHPSWQMKTISEIRSSLRHTGSTIDVVLMDIEGLEWGALSEMANTGELSLVHQLLVGYNTGESTDKASYLSRLKILQQIEKLGFRKFYADKQIKCPQQIGGFPSIRTKCYEVHYVLRE